MCCAVLVRILGLCAASFTCIHTHNVHAHKAVSGRAGSAGAFLLTSSPRAALVGASGSVFGLFVVSVLSKLSQFNLRRLVCLHRALRHGRKFWSGGSPCNYQVSPVEHNCKRYLMQVEILAMAPFVYGQIMSNAAMQLSGAASSVSYIAHLGGAATGFLLVVMLALLPGDN